MCRPFGPFGAGNVHNCSATFGASRLATAQAEGALKIRALCPEISALLFEASSQAKTLGGKNGTAFFKPFQHCSDRVAPDRDLALGVDQLRAMAVEHRADPLHR